MDRKIVNQFRKCGAFAKTAGLRTTFRPDQFVVVNSPQPDVVEQSIQEIEYQAEVAQWIGADVVNIHGGGAYGDKQVALQTLAKNFARLSKKARRLVTLENDADGSLYTGITNDAPRRLERHNAGTASRCLSSV